MELRDMRAHLPPVRPPHPPQQVLPDQCKTPCRPQCALPTVLLLLACPLLRLVFAAVRDCTFPWKLPASRDHRPFDKSLRPFGIVPVHVIVARMEAPLSPVAGRYSAPRGRKADEEFDRARR